MNVSSKSKLVHYLVVFSSPSYSVSSVKSRSQTVFAWTIQDVKCLLNTFVGFPLLLPESGRTYAAAYTLRPAPKYDS